MSMDIKDTKARLSIIRDHTEELEEEIDDLWDAYIEVLEERDELLEKVKELETNHGE